MARILDSVVGHQPQIAKLLESVQQKRLHPSLIFSGPSGIGKKVVALGLAQALVCEHGNAGCGVCGACRRLEKQQRESFLLVEPENDSKTKIINVKQIREVLSFLHLRHLGRARVVVIDYAENMHPSAANALLKSIEEPPPNSYFIFLTEGVGSLLPTVRSRSQTVLFNALANEQLRQLRPKAPDWVIKESQGRVGKADELEQQDFGKLREMVLGLLASVTQKPAKDMHFFDLKAATKERENALFMLEVLMRAVRDAMKDKARGDLGENLGRRFSMAALGQLWQELVQVEKDIDGNIDRALALENFFLRAQTL